MARRLVARESGEWESMMMMKMKDGEEEKRSTAVVTKKRGYDITRNPYLNKVHTHTHTLPGTFLPGLERSRAGS